MYDENGSWNDGSYKKSVPMGNQNGDIKAVVIAIMK